VKNITPLRQHRRRKIDPGTSTVRRLQWEPFYEPVPENPYLPDFYRDMSTWSFHSRCFF
jgi:hypothetical protein